MSDLRLKQAEENYLNGVYTDADLEVIFAARKKEHEERENWVSPNDEAYSLLTDTMLDPAAPVTDILASQGISAAKFALFDQSLEEIIKSNPARFANGSLEGLAWLLEKDPKTIVRRCKDGTISSQFCYKTKGGHWRIKWEALAKSDVRAIQAAVDKVGRAAKRKPGDVDVDYWIERTQRAKNFQLAAAGEYTDGVKLIREDVNTDKKAKAHGVYLKTLPETAFEAVEAAPRKVALHTACRRLDSLGQKLTSTNIAKEMGVAKQTLYNWFSQDEIKQAKKMSVRGAPRSGASKGEDDDQGQPTIDAVAGSDGCASLNVGAPGDDFYEKIDEKLGFTDSPVQSKTIRAQRRRSQGSGNSGKA